jgi:excisionase family DNA binding protein
MRPTSHSSGLTRTSSGQLLYVADVASLLNCSQKSIRARVARHLLPHRRLGARVVFVRSELEQFIEMLPGTTLAEARQNLALRNGERSLR